jgi:hypothetical protein
VPVLAVVAGFSGDRDSVRLLVVGPICHLGVSHFSRVTKALDETHSHADERPVEVRLRHQPSSTCLGAMTLLPDDAEPDIRAARDASSAPGCGVASATVTYGNGIMSAMPRPRIALLAGAALCAILIGGVAQTYVWRWGLDGVTKVTNTQFAWALLCFVVALAWAQGRVSWGMVAGGLTGLGLISSYYGVQWFADGWHSAASQFAGTYGFAWTVAATGGGALVGVLGGLAGSSAEVHPTRKAVGLSTTALLVGLGPLAWFKINGDLLHQDGIWVAITFYGTVGAGLVAFAFWECGVAPFLRGLFLGALTALVTLAGLLVLQGTVLYTTF